MSLLIATLSFSIWAHRMIGGTVFFSVPSNLQPRPELLASLLDNGTRSKSWDKSVLSGLSLLDFYDQPEGLTGGMEILFLMMKEYFSRRNFAERFKNSIRRLSWLTAVSFLLWDFMENILDWNKWPARPVESVFPLPPLIWVPSYLPTFSRGPKGSWILPKSLRNNVFQPTAFR